MTTTTAAAAAPAPSGTTDPRPVFARATATACDVLAALRPGQLSAATPCTEYDVRTLGLHVVAVLRRVAAVGRGADPFSVPQVADDVADGDLAAAAREAAADVMDVWADPSLLGRPLRLPFGTFPGAAALAAYTCELTTHAWDLAVATGQSPAWDPEAVAVGLAAARLALPAEGRGPGVPFAEVVPVPADAPGIDQLVAWQGRDPGWRP